jgi:hypothetical protein
MVGWFVCLKSRGHRLTVRFLETGTGASSSVLFRFTATRITDQHVAVVLHERLSQFVLGLFVHVLGVVGHDGFGNGRPNGVNLRRNTTALDTDADVDIAKFLLSYNQDGFKDLQTKRLGLNQLNGLAVDLDETATLLGKGHRGGGLFPVRSVRMLVSDDECTISPCLERRTISR